MNKKSSGSRSRKQRLTAVGTRCADHVTPLYPQKLALTSPTGGGRSVGIVHSRTKATEFSLVQSDRSPVLTEHYIKIKINAIQCSPNAITIIFCFQTGYGTACSKFRSAVSLASLTLLYFFTILYRTRYSISCTYLINGKKLS